MKAPIITNENGDICFFETIQDAATYLEPVDIQNNEYEIFDSEGAILKGIPTKPCIELIETEEEPNNDKLLYIIRSFYTAIGLDPVWVKNANLNELISYGVKEYAEK